MSRADEIFIANMRDILENGVTDADLKVRPKWSDGTSAHTVKKFGIVNRYNLQEEFPILTIRKTFFKSCVKELLWIWQKKSNNIKDLKRCIFSIITQSCTDFELIIVDDGSTDGSSELCDWFADKDERIFVVRRNSNGGVACARNEGLTYAKGKYVYYVDGDDWIAKKLLESARKELDKEYSPDIYAFWYVKVMENGEPKRIKVCTKCLRSGKVNRV